MHIPHQLTERVKLLQKIAIIRQQHDQPEVLLLQRSQTAKSRPGAWDLPGGNSEWPQQNQVSASNLHLQDVVRELQEETGIQLDPGKLDLSKTTHLSTYFAADQQIYTIIVGWMAALTDTDQAMIRLSAEHQQYAWVSRAQLVDYDFGGPAGSFVQEMAAQAFVK